ncbi:anthranilate synthase component I family protein [Occultella glacieicola]|uniref:Anthranilate synthase component I family protein n=1 Tax=Occultella glacieicola TaxID=2518684 RepID=A0ABY2E1X2_9MICO|nr:chorismate-binding protein [Occultella glacieicola]TDE92448.1 anthranilate synthase component I family protein [Occultella glacieicola]
MTTPPPPPDRGRAWFRGVRARDVVDYADLAREPEALAAGGWWVVVAEFEGPVHAWRFGDVHRTGAADAVVREAPPWRGPAPGRWRTSMSREEYVGAVEAVRSAVLEGEVYQANICRVLSAPLTGPQPSPAVPDGGGWRPDAAALAVRLATGNPAPYAALVDVPAAPEWPGSWVVSASPELSVRVRDGYVTSGPIKGTAVTADGLGAKDRAENIMITDLVRNDLARVCLPGTVEVTDLLATEEHPGLVHLVSRVRGRLAPGPGGGVDWAALLAATHPPGSVSGAPKSSALRLIGELEPTSRGPYCGQIGWLDADAGEARLAVGIRTFWWADGMLRFGTGAGITWGSDAQAEWEETELKARRLVGLASTSR